MIGLKSGMMPSKKVAGFVQKRSFAATLTTRNRFVFVEHRPTRKLSICFFFNTKNASSKDAKTETWKKTPAATLSTENIIIASILVQNANISRASMPEKGRILLYTRAIMPVLK